MSGIVSSMFDDFLSEDDLWELVVSKKKLKEKHQIEQLIYIGHLYRNSSGLPSVLEKVLNFINCSNKTTRSRFILTNIWVSLSSRDPYP